MFFYHILGMAAILFNGRRSNVKYGEISHGVSEKKTFKDYMILCMYIAQRRGQTTLRDKHWIVTNPFFYFNHTL